MSLGGWEKSLYNIFTLYEIDFIHFLFAFKIDRFLPLWPTSVRRVNEWPVSDTRWAHTFAEWFQRICRIDNIELLAWIRLDPLSNIMRPNRIGWPETMQTMCKLYTQTQGRWVSHRLRVRWICASTAVNGNHFVGAIQLVSFFWFFVNIYIFCF